MLFIMPLLKILDWLKEKLLRNSKNQRNKIPSKCNNFLQKSQYIYPIYGNNQTIFFIFPISLRLESI